jgi:hypothetical protein
MKFFQDENLNLVKTQLIVILKAINLFKMKLKTTMNVKKIEINYKFLKSTFQIHLFQVLKIQQINKNYINI